MSEELRVDKWLWFARFAKSRAIAARLCAEGSVAIGGVTIRKPHHPVRVGDCLAVRQGPWRREVRVLALGARRGPAAEARLLYEERTPPVRLRAELEPWSPLLEEG